MLTLRGRQACEDRMSNTHLTLEAPVSHNLAARFVKKCLINVHVFLSGDLLCLERFHTRNCYRRYCQDQQQNLVSHQSMASNLVDNMESSWRIHNRVKFNHGLNAPVHRQEHPSEQSMPYHSYHTDPASIKVLHERAGRNTI